MSVKKHWAIVGAGNGAQAFAGYFSLLGREIRMYDAFPAAVDKLNELGGVTLEGNGRQKGFGRIALASTDMEEVVSGAEVIWVVMPSIYHKVTAVKMAPYLEDGQIVILNPVAALGTMEFAKALKDNGCNAEVVLAATSTLLFACRLIEPGRVMINGQKEYLSIAAQPASKNDYVKAAVGDYVPEFTFVDNILSIFFENVNFEVHPGPCMLYSSMIEGGIPFDYYTDFRPSQARLALEMDKERMAICEAYDLKGTQTLTEVFKSLYGYEGDDLLTLFNTADCYKGLKGPTSMNVRYLTEDIPYALVGVQTLARIAGVKTPVIDSVINLAYALYGENLDEGRTIEAMGWTEEMTAEDVLAICR